MATKVYRDLIWTDPERVSGMPCFYGTRVPVAHLFEHLEGDYTVERFAETFVLPIEQVQGVLEAAKQALWRELDALEARPPIERRIAKRVAAGDRTGAIKAGAPRADNQHLLKLTTFLQQAEGVFGEVEPHLHEATHHRRGL